MTLRLGVSDFCSLTEWRDLMSEATDDYLTGYGISFLGIEGVDALTGLLNKSEQTANYVPSRPIKGGYSCCLLPLTSFRL